MSDNDLEFGVPFPGTVLPPDRWTKTGLRDSGQPFDWKATFGREAPRVVDLGCGNGRYLIGSALTRPDRDHVGMDVVQVAIDFGAQRANRRGLSNVRFVVGDAAVWMYERFAKDSIDEVHVYHPQPYYEPGEEGNRLMTPDFFERIWLVLRRGGYLILQTDNKAYWKYVHAAALKYFEPGIVRDPWPDAPLGRTRREIQARRQGLKVWRLQAKRRETPLDVQIAEPEFDANRPKFRKGRR